MRIVTANFRAMAVLACMLLSLFMPMAARASAAACYRLAYVVNPSDLKRAYNFVVDHGECIAHFEDETFDAIAAGITGAMATGVIQPQTCQTALDIAGSPAANALKSVADLNVVSEYLDCGCAVANSGIAQKIKDITSDMESCAGTLNPRDIVYGGLQKAGKALGYDTLWGLEQPGPDPRAGVGNGGAPTSDFGSLPTCTKLGVDIEGMQIGDGYFYPSCNCPAPASVWTSGHRFILGEALIGRYFKCMAACGPGQALQNGKCGFCPSLGPNSENYPNAARTQCVGLGWGQVINPCKSWQGWQGGNTCVDKCPGKIYQGGACVSCPKDHQPHDNICQACPAGSHGDGEFCTGGFPLPGCGPGQINDPAQGGQCSACPAGTEPNAAGDQCLQFVCQGNAIPDPKHAHTCMLCPNGTKPDKAGKSCVRPGLKNLIKVPVPPVRQVQ